MPRYDDDYRPRYDDEDDYDRPRRRPTPQPNGLATTSLVLGLLSLFCLAFTGLPAIICGVLGIMKASRIGGSGKGTAIAGLVLGVFGTTVVTGAAVWSTIKAVEATNKAIQNTMQQINTMTANFEVVANQQKANAVAVGVKDSEATLGKLPNPYETVPDPAATAKDDKPTRPGLSWRVDVLPYLNEQNLHQKFAQDEPWDSATNRPLSRQRVEYFVAVADPPTTADTRWRGFTGPGTVFEPGQTMRLPMIVDGASNTVLFVESAELVTWTEPNDYPFTNPFARRPARKGEKKHALPTLGRPNADGFLMAMCDGSVRYVKKTIDPETLNRLIVRNDGLALPPGWDDPPASFQPGQVPPPPPPPPAK